MPTKKISEHAALGAAPATNDVLLVNDVSPSLTTKTMTVANLQDAYDAVASDLNTGTSTTLFATPDALAGSSYGTRYIYLPVADANTTPSTGDGKAHVVIPATLNGWDVVSVLGCVTTVSSSGTPNFALRRLRAGSAVDVLSTNVTIDANEYTSTTAAAAAVINTSNDDLATDDILLVDLDTVGTSAKGHGLLVGIRLP